MKNSLFRFIDLLFCLAIFLFGCYCIGLGIRDWREQNRLREHGVPTVGQLQNATTTSYPLGYATYTLNINYLNHNKNFRADKTLYEQVASGGKFRINTPIDILYLPEQPRSAILPAMIGQKNRIYFIILFGGFFIWLGAGWIKQWIQKHPKGHRT